MAEARSPALDPGSRAWALAVTVACLAPLLLQLPGATALAIGGTGLVIGAISWRRALPFAARALLAAAIIAAVVAQFGMQFGRDTGCALLGAMLALKPAETMSLRDARSLVGFALFAPFSTFLLDQGPTTLILGLVASLLALGALQRLTALESGIAPPPLARPVVHALRLVAYGLPLAMAVFWLFPRIGTPLWGVPDRASARSGLSDEMSPGDWVSLLADDSIAVRARFDGAMPPRSALYWRGPVLWDFDGRSWRRPAGLGRIDMPDPVPGATTWTYTLEVEPTDRSQLVALDMPLAAPGGARMREDSSLVAERPLASLTRWRMTSALPSAYRGALPDDARRRALALPAGFNPRAVALGRDLKRRLRDDEAVIDHVLGWIRKDFAYSIAAPPLGRDTVDEFLFGTRLGYCEHFAGAFTVLMRSAGIPTRVVTGYVGGQRNRIGGYWMIRRMDAHAWTEVWLEGRGWARVDPTAAVAPENIYDTLEDQLPADGLIGAIQGGDGIVQVGDWLRQNWNDLVLGFDANRQARMFRPLGLERVGPEQLAILFAVATSLALGLMVALSLRGPRERDPVLRAWHRLGARYARRGLGRAAHEPSTTWAERIGKSGAASAGELVDLAARFTRWRYAGSIADGESARRLARDLRAHRPR
ncbi:transglutaminase TgpA family protein [Lysobacter humi (ex Lee et al. 2017)]